MSIAKAAPSLRGASAREPEARQAPVESSGSAGTLKILAAQSHQVAGFHDSNRQTVRAGPCLPQTTGCEASRRRVEGRLFTIEIAEEDVLDAAAHTALV